MKATIALFLTNCALRAMNLISFLLRPVYDRLIFYKHTNFEFKPRPDDIFIVTYPRSGTTWLQMILYQLTTKGDMDFTHINDVCPFFEVWRPDHFEGLPSPRVFKSHLSFKQVPKFKCKYIYACRNGTEVLVSSYHFRMSFGGFTGTFDDFFSMYSSGKDYCGLWSEHVAGWRNNACGLDILFLKYEDMITDLEGTVRKIIKFCNLPVAESEIPRVLERSSFDFMKKYESKFDAVTHKLQMAGWKLNEFLRQGKMFAGEKYFKPEQLASLTAEYRKNIKSADQVYFLTK